jgi:hypothetical protein
MEYSHVKKSRYGIRHWMDGWGRGRELWNLLACITQEGHEFEHPL